jgi:transposase-like protein
MALDNYTEVTGVSFKNEMDTIITSSLQSKLNEHEINHACYKCGSINVVKKGKRPDGVQRYICKDCSTNFTLFSGTILEKTRWHWDVWVKVLEMTINHLSLDSMHNALVHDYGCEGINRKTIWLWRLKLVHALASIEPPKLTGIVQIDETFIRESQKGSRQLESYLINPNIRKPRYGYQPSKLGSLGPEFATVITAIDDRGYCVCKLATLGKASEDMLVDIFEDHINNPAYICSDANSIYKKYCNIFDIPHYIKPSNYKKIIKDKGYTTPD